MRTFAISFYTVDTSSEVAVVVWRVIRDFYAPEINCSPMRLKGLTFVGADYLLGPSFLSFFLSLFFFLEGKGVVERKGWRESKGVTAVLFLGG